MWLFLWFFNFLWFLMLLLLRLWLWWLWLRLWWLLLWLLLWLLFLLLIKHLQIFRYKRLCALNNCFVLVERVAFRLWLSNIQYLSLNCADTLTLLIDLLLLVYSHKWLLLLLIGSWAWHLNDQVVRRSLTDGSILGLRESMRDWRRVNFRVQVIGLNLLNLTFRHFWCSLGFIFGGLLVHIFHHLNKLIANSVLH